MIEERIAWEFESEGTREQLRLRNKSSDYFGPPARVLPFEREILDREPPYDETVAAVIQALQDLGTCRQIGMGLGPIPYTEIVEYVTRKGYDAEAVEIMTSAVLEADRIYLAERAKKAAVT